MEGEHNLEDFIDKFFKTAPPLSLDELETETLGFMSFFDIFLELNLFTINTGLIT